MNKTWIGIIAMLAVVLLFVAQSGKPRSFSVSATPQLTSRQVKLDQELKQREAIAREAVAVLADLYAKTNDEEVKQLLDFANEYGVLSIPSGPQTSFFRGVPRSKDFFLVPLGESDRRYGGMWSNLLDYESGSNYLPEHRCLVLKNWNDMSRDWNTIKFAHELRHAKTHLVDHPDWNWRDNLTRYSDERDTHSFHNRLLLKLGGKRYAAYRMRLADRLLAEMQKAGVSLQDQFPLNVPYDEELETIFGPAKTEHEKIQRRTIVWIDAGFRLIDSLYRGDKEQRKSFFLAWIDIQTGKLKVRK